MTGSEIIETTRPWVYIAGPYTAHPTRCAGFAMDVWEGLRAAGVRAVCPHWSMVQDTKHTLDFADWIDFDLALIERLRPDAIVRLPGRSPGADREVAYARSLGIRVLEAPAHCGAAGQVVEFVRATLAMKRAEVLT